MTEENAQVPEDEGLETVEGVTGDDIGLAPDFFKNTEDTETSETATGADEELSQESDEQSAVDEGGDATSDGPEAAASAQTEEATPTPATDTQEQPKTFYKYGDHEFGSPDEVSQYLKTIEGRQRVTQVAHQDALQKNDAWVEWSKDAAEVRKHLAKLEGVEPDKVKVTEEKKTFLDGTDWDRLRGLVEQGKGMEALAHMAHMYDQVLEQRLGQVEAKFESKVAPYANREAARDATVTLFKQAEVAMDSQGNLLWPEFNRESEQFDPQFCQLFSQVWEKLPANIAWDENGHGIELAYSRTKQLMSQRTPAATQETGTTEEGDKTTAQERARAAARDAQGRFVKQTEDAATSVGGSGATPPPTSSPSESYQEAAILRDMDRADQDRDPVFGIRR